MKKITFLALLMIVITHSTFSQKMYVWCQKEQLSTPRKGFLINETINLIVFDGRMLTSKSKIECSSEVVTNNLAQLIKQTYPSAKINILKSEEYYKKSEDSLITIKVAISAYHAAFGANVTIGIGSVGGSFSWGAVPKGKWNAVTGYSVNLYDYRKGNHIKKTKNIGKIASRPNTGGYRTAKNILNRTYLEANQELLFFIDECFME